MAIKGILALPEGEEEIIEGCANKVWLWSGPGGRLILTNRGVSPQHTLIDVSRCRA